MIHVYHSIKIHINGEFLSNFHSCFDDMYFIAGYFQAKKKKKETEGFYRLFLPFLKHSGKMNARLMIS